MPDEKIPDDVLWHQSGVNGKGEPFVQLIRGNAVIAQMDPEQARDHAIAILEASEAAEQDAFILDFMQTKVGLDYNRAGQVLLDFRRYRQERTGKRGGPTNAREWVMPPPPPKCTIPPAGWRCTREAGHDGPCAALRDENC